MKTKVLWALVALNVLLLAALASGFGRSNLAHAQGAPRPGEYIMISGEVQGGTAGVVYMIDETNRLLSARSFDGRQFQDMAPIDLDRVFNPGGGAGGRGRGGR